MYVLVPIFIYNLGMVFLFGGLLIVFLVVYYT
nr:MAG TPA: hypothetical protein [Bacteriophage sp.]